MSFTYQKIAILDDSGNKIGDMTDCIKRKEDNQDNSQEKKIYLEQRKIINSQEDCDEINNAQSQKNCLDTYL